MAGFSHTHNSNDQKPTCQQVSYDSERSLEKSDHIDK